VTTTHSRPGGRAGDDGERSFNWFEPRKRRASLYEDVTVDTQPSTARHVRRGWPMYFEDGRGTWDERSTALAVADWYAFRDPGERWERSFYQVESRYEAEIEGAVRSARTARLFEDFGADWVEFLRANLQVPAFVEHGLWLALATTARDCLSDTLAHCVAIEAANKQRHAQAIVLYALDLEPHFGEIPIERARERFLREGAWQPTREYLERLRTITDWGEMIVAVNVCFEPVVSVAIRRELGIRAAIQNGDALTPTVARVADLEWDWARQWTIAFVELALGDETHGEANRERIAGWLEAWQPRASAALDALEGLGASVPGGFSFASARERIEHDTQELLAAAGLEPAAAGAEPAGGVR
jgi:propane monooxygenase small subunit